MAFVQNQNLTCVNQPQNGQVVILPADAQALKVLYVGGPNGSKVAGSILACSTDTSARDVQVGINNGGTISGSAGAQTVTGGTSIPISTTTVAIGAGNSGAVPPANLMPTPLALDSDGQPYIFLQAGEVLYVQALTTVTAAKQIGINALNIGDF